MAARLSIAVIGAGMGGLAVAAALLRAGVDVTVYEQARKFARLGAGIQVGCNAMQVLRGLGLEQRIRSEAFYPRSWNNRDWRSGEVRYDQIFGPAAEAKYGAPYLLAHRGDLHATLASAVPAERIRLDHKLTGLDDKAGSVVLGFADGSTAVHDGVVAADGVHSLVRELLFGAEKPSFIGRIAYRTIFPAALLGGYDIGECTKWWGEDRHIVIYYVKPDRGEVYFVTSQPEPGFTVESWSAKGDMPTLRRRTWHRAPPWLSRTPPSCPGCWRRSMTRLAYPARSAAWRRPASPAPPESSSPRGPTPGCARRPTSTGSTATTRGPPRWRPDHASRPSPLISG